MFVARFRLLLSKYFPSREEIAPHLRFDRRMVEFSLCYHNADVEYQYISTSYEKLKFQKDDNKEEMLNFTI